jgi:ribonuclease HII
MLLTHAQEWALKIIHETHVDHIIGIDEVGLGAIAGPLVVAGAVFERRWSDTEVRDSKKFSGGGRVAHEKRLRVLEECIKPVCKFQQIECVSHREVDALGMAQALEDAIRRIGIRCSHAYPDSMLVVDGDNFPRLYRVKAVVALPKGDALIPAVGAASIIAKTTRDALMITEDAVHPGYGFDQHMGYAVPDHIHALERLGPCPIHRMSYKPVQNAAAVWRARQAK